MIKGITASLFVLFINTAFAQDDAAKSNWATAPVKVDGDSREWVQPFKYYDATTKLFFAFANDDQNLYLCFQVPNEAEQIKIMRAGMEVTITARGKKKIKGTLTYPFLQENDTLPGEQPGKDEKTGNDHKWQTGIKGDHSKWKGKIKAEGFITANAVMDADNTTGLNIAAAWDSAHKFAYEISIPLKELFGEEFNINDIGKELSLDVVVNAVTKRDRPVNNGNGGRNFSGGRMGGGRRMGGGGGSWQHNRNGENSGPPANAANSSSMFEKTEMKEDFVLAKKAK
ncbi:MAG: hypothetical protein QM791_00930 [Ferruginibacter sp.]